VIANIAINALQAMESSDERRITIRTSARDSETVQVDIEDTGTGIPQEQFARLFQSFFTTKPGGMGIGLAMCRSIIEAHGGSIDATNLPDGGARFRVTLPVGGPG
jgi:signal transduction histidine kinase